MDDTIRRYCVVKGIGGLGNRLFTIAKAIEYAQASDRTLYVDWRDGMNGPEGDDVFYRYFDLHRIEHVSSPDAVRAALKNGSSVYPAFLGLPNFDRPLSAVCAFLKPRLWTRNKVKVFLAPLFRHKVGNWVGLDSWQDKSTPISQSYMDSVRGYFSSGNFPMGGRMSTRLKEKVVVFADYQPVIRAKWFRDHIFLKAQYLEMFRKFSQERRLDEAVGIHIRYTDKKPTAKLSRVISVLKNMLKKAPNLQVFLATDNIDVLNDFKKEFGERLIVYPKSLPPASAKGLHHWARTSKDDELKRRVLEDGLADMWLLSMTKYLFRQGNSSFSGISRLLRNDPFHTVDWLKL